MSVTFAFTLYNCSETIERALKSALSQDYHDRTILLVDDCSTDNTILIVNNILSNSSENYEIIKHRENAGVAVSRNTLIRKCNTEFIAFFDDDDISLPERVSCQMNMLLAYEKKNPLLQSSPLCYCNRILYMEDQRPLPITAVHIDLRFVSAISAVNALLAIGPFPKKARNGSSATCTMFARTTTLLDCGGFKPALRRFEDVGIAISALLQGSSLISTNTILVKQFYTQTLDKIHEYKYNLALLRQFRHLYQSKKLYRFAMSYIILKNKHLFKSRTLSLYLHFMLLSFANPIKVMQLLMSALNFRYALKKVKSKNQ